MKYWDLDEDCNPIQVQVNQMEDNKQMATLKETAQAYEPPQTLNIADLEVVSIDVDVKEDTGTNKEGDDFTYNYIEVDNKRYRVPNSVLTELKTMIEEQPNLQKFKVKKTGSGLQTRYTVIPLV